MSSLSIYKLYVVPKFILSTMDDILISPFTFDMECTYLKILFDSRVYAVKHIPNMKNSC